jgi:ApaG protein
MTSEPKPYAFNCSAVPAFLPEQSDAERNIYAFAYTVTITNTGSVAAQLISRHWIMSDENGRTEQIKGLGVIGQQPFLKPGQTFEYSSWTRLGTPSGAMHGAFFFVAEDGARFEALVPEFVLTAPADGVPRVLH